MAHLSEDTGREGRNTLGETIRGLRKRAGLTQEQLAEELSLGSAEQVLLPEILFLKARALHHLGVEEEPRTIVRAVAPYMELIGRGDLAAQVRAFAERELGERIR